ncbi:MAG: DNA mismatch repair protein MutS [Treponema sp.]|jgi:DNA mismatch repair protein MutS|nr:DNA mismatch repair protein MutS [Treponema sp.]
MKNVQTPMLDQYRRIKQEQKGAILFFRLGDFYEMFADDAVEVSGLLNLTLTSRSKIPMCGVPHHAARSYIARLLKLGKKVAVCEQITEPGRGLIERKVVEVVTPGVIIDEDFLDKGSSNYLACLCRTSGGGKDGVFSFAYIDISAGDFYATSFERKDAAPKIRQELERLQMREIIVQESLLHDNAIAAVFEERNGMVINRWGDWLFDRERSVKRLKRQFGSLKGFGLDDDSPEALSAGALLEYLDETASGAVGGAAGVIPHVASIRLYSDSEFVCIDESSQRNLELIKNLQDGDIRFSLLETLDETRTAMGRRLLKRRLLQPLRNLGGINRRLDMVEKLYRNQKTLEQIRDILGKTPDLERLLSRLAMDRAHGKDMLAIKNALASFATLEKLCKDFLFEHVAASSFTKEQSARLNDARDALACGLREDPSILLTEGNLIRSGYNAELDKLHALRDNGHGMLEAYLEEERQATGISSLKIRYNRLIGYYFEVTNNHLSKVPKYFFKRQGLVNGERFSTDKLASLESGINSASGEIIEFEKKLFLELREKTKACLNELAAASARIAEVDVAQSLARAATLRLWARPELHEGCDLHITESRHPVVESHLPRGEFIPNDIHLDRNGVAFALITGPNMAGKSTYLRQAALIVIMAQMGSFVPAAKAGVGLVDRVYCRVGASDNLARGESTFLVEMNETAYILHTATEKSLVIMDEVGRGTGTKDGLAIAWAVSEELLDAIQCRTLFATHYHELSSLAHPRMANRSMDVIDNEGELIFLRKLKDGAASESYGLHAARLAGLSAPVLERAGIIMERLQADETALRTALKMASKSRDMEEQGVFTPPALPPPVAGGGGRQDPDAKRQASIIREIAAMDINALAPLDALNRIHEWKRLLGGGAVKQGAARGAERVRKQKPDADGAGLFEFM